MSEEKQAEAAPAEGTPAKPAGPPMPVILGIAAGALAVGAVAGTLFVGPMIGGKSKPAGEGAKKEEKEHGGGHGGGHGKGKEDKSIVYKIENIIVNPAGCQGTRFLMAGVAFELADEKIESQLRDHEPEVRDAVVSTLERQTIEMLTRPGARDSLKSELGRVIAPIAGGPPVHVYLPQLVLQ